MAVDAISALLSLVIGNLHTDKLFELPKKRAEPLCQIRRNCHTAPPRTGIRSSLGVKVVKDESVCPIHWIILLYLSDFMLHNCDKKAEKRSFG
jgi:hypothetical protein